MRGDAASINIKVVALIFEVALIGWLIGGKHDALLALAIILGIVLIMTFAESVKPPGGDHERRG